jgi:hypothetical protein
MEINREISLEKIREIYKLQGLTVRIYAGQICP